MAQEKTRPPASPIGGIFPRWIALAFDILAVAGLGLLAGRLLGPALSNLGGEARLLGYAAFVAYFGLFDRFAATPGKQLFKLVVRRADGSRVPLPLTLLRSAILFLPFVCSGPNPGLAKWNSALTTAEVGIFYVLGGALPLVWLLGGRSRQSVHDLVCQTYVLKTGATGLGQVRPARRWQGGLTLAWTAIVLGTMAKLQLDKFTRWPAQTKLEAADRAILKLPGVKGTGYMLMAQVPDGKPSERLLPSMSAAVPQLPKTLVVSVDLRRKPRSPQTLEQQVVQALVANYPLAARQASIQVILAYGYDIGIARSYKAIATDTRTAAQWGHASSQGAPLAKPMPGVMLQGAADPLQGLELKNDNLGGGLRASRKDGP